MTTRKRDRSGAVLVLLTPEQHKTLRAAAARLGLGLGPWLRALGLAAVQQGAEPVKPGVRVPLDHPGRGPAPK